MAGLEMGTLKPKTFLLLWLAATPSHTSALAHTTRLRCNALKRPVCARQASRVGAAPQHAASHTERCCHVCARRRRILCGETCNDPTARCCIARANCAELDNTNKGTTSLAGQGHILTTAIHRALVFTTPADTCSGGAISLSKVRTTC